MEQAQRTALKWGRLTPMRCSALMFLLPLSMCVMRKRWMGACVLAFVLASSVATHRPRSVWSMGRRERVDLLAIGVWCTYNTYLTLCHFVEGRRCGVAVACALVGAVVDATRNRLAYRSRARDALHVHFLGSLGTSLLIV